MNEHKINNFYKENIELQYKEKMADEQLKSKEKEIAYLQNQIMLRY